MEKLIVTLNGKDFVADFDEANDNVININGHSYNIELLKSHTENIHTFSVNQKLVQIDIDLRESEMGYITVNGLTHELEVNTETKKMLERFIKQKADAEGNKNAVIKSPMPGLVIKIPVEAGQKIAKGDKIIIIEAMKMENSLSSPISGTIKSISAREGSAVEKNALLMEIEGD
jgi:biotin carboxyl carrier protein